MSSKHSMKLRDRRSSQGSTNYAGSENGEEEEEEEEEDVEGDDEEEEADTRPKGKVAHVKGAKAKEGGATTGTKAKAAGETPSAAAKGGKVSAGTRTKQHRPEVIMLTADQFKELLGSRNARKVKSEKKSQVIVSDGEDEDEHKAAAKVTGAKTVLVIRWTFKRITNVAITIFSILDEPEKHPRYLAFVSDPKRATESVKVLANRVTTLLEGRYRENTQTFQRAIADGEKVTASRESNARVVLAEFVSMYVALEGLGASHTLFQLRQVIMRREEAEALSEDLYNPNVDRGYQELSSEIITNLLPGEDTWPQTILRLHRPKLEEAALISEAALALANFRLNLDLCGETFTTKTEWQSYLRGATTVRSRFELGYQPNGYQPQESQSTVLHLGQLTAAASNFAAGSNVMRAPGSTVSGTSRNGGRYANSFAGSVTPSASASQVGRRPAPQALAPAAIAPLNVPDGTPLALRQELEEAFRSRPLLRNRIGGPPARVLAALKRCHRCLRPAHGDWCSNAPYPGFHAREPGALLTKLATGDISNNFPSLDNPASLPP